MSQSKTQTHVHNIRSRIREDGLVQCDHGTVPLLTSKTHNNPHRQFFTCLLPKEDKNKCKFFAWLDDIREYEGWDENLFRTAYPQYRPPEDKSAVPETPRKRRTPPSSLPGPTLSPKRVCHGQPEEDHYLSDEESFASPRTSMTMATNSIPTTPSRLNRGGLRSTRTEWPLTPSSPRTRGSQTLVADTSPSRESVRRHETRVTAPLSYLQNFDGVTDLSPLSLTPNFKAAQSLPARAVASADDVEEVISIANNVTLDYVRLLERRSIASQKASDAKMARIQQLEIELERSQQQITKLSRENERLTRLRSCESDRLARLHSP